MATNFKPESLRRHIRGAAQTRIGKNRTEARDIARILIEHGAHSSAAENEVISAISATIPPATYNRDRVRELNQRLTDHAHAGYSLGELQRAGGRRTGGRWGEIKQIDHELTALHTEGNRRSDDVDRAVKSWWRQNNREIERIALEEAQAILKQRQ